MSDVLLEVRDLWKCFPSGAEVIEVLRGLELCVRKGEVVAITGESGSGKSTLLHIIGAMERPDRGSIAVGGRDLAELDDEGRARFRNETIGFVFQFHHLLPEFSALENAMFPLLLRGAPFAQSRETAERLLREVGLEQRATHQPGELSGGEQQRLALARALSGSPQLLLADEPTGNLDPTTAERMFDLLLQIHRSRELTSIVVTHNPGLAGRCHRRLRMAAGRLEEL